MFAQRFLDPAFLVREDVREQQVLVGCAANAEVELGHDLKHGFANPVF